MSGGMRSMPDGGEGDHPNLQGSSSAAHESSGETAPSAAQLLWQLTAGGGTAPLAGRGTRPRQPAFRPPNWEPELRGGVGGGPGGLQGRSDGGPGFSPGGKTSAGSRERVSAARPSRVGAGARRRRGGGRSERGGRRVGRQDEGLRVRDRHPHGRRRRFRLRSVRTRARP